VTVAFREGEGRTARVTRSIARRLRELGDIGRDPAGGWTRIAFGNAERHAHELFAGWAGQLGLEVSVDAIGNSYARRPGEGPALMTGSHLDTVPRGGNFDGAAGVVAALEAAALLEDESLQHPLTVVCFACEEGARFTAPCVGSRAITGGLDQAGLESLQDDEGISVYHAATAAGLHPELLQEAVWKRGSVAAYVELHIEQGRVLQESERKLGIIDTIAGSTRLEIALLGRSDHSGTTPMTMRQDALLGAAEVCLMVERAASRSRTAVATVGRMRIAPNVVTTVPGEARFTVDVRDIDPLRQREVAEDVVRHVNSVAGRRQLRARARLLHDQSPFVLPFWVREELAAAAQAEGVPYRVMPSGAGHDAGYVSVVAPTGMLFVPSREGISHSPQEWTEVEDIAVGAMVLARSLQRLDSALSMAT
jgi:hydantoinase/carbamoylase family amidase